MAFNRMILVTSPRSVPMGLVVLWVFMLLAPVYAAPSLDLPGMWLGALAGVSALAVVVVLWVARSPEALVTIILCLGIFQNLLIGLLNRVGTGDADAGVFLVGFTTAFVWLAVAGVVLKYRLVNVDKTLLWTQSVYLLYMTAWFILSPYSLAAKLPAFRNATAFVWLFWVSYGATGISISGISKTVRAWRILTWVLLLFGLVEQFVLQDWFWSAIGHIDFIMDLKNLPPYLYSPFTVPRDFYTPMAGAYYRRMVSLVGSSVTLGYLLAFSFFASVAVLRYRRTGFRIFEVLVIGGGVALTLVKGAYQIVGLGLAVLAFRWIFPRVRFSRGVVIIVIVGIVGSYVALDFFPGSTVGLHVQGLIAPIIQLRGVEAVIGHGMGSGGKISARLIDAREISFAEGAESGIGSLYYQTGGLGVGLYLVSFLILLRRLWDRLPSGGTRNFVDILRESVLAALIALLGNSFLQENAFAIIPISPFFLFAGLVLRATTEGSLRKTSGPREKF